MDFKLDQNFKEDLKNVSSPAFKELASTVATALDTVYRNKYGSSFNRTEVLGFRKGSIEVNAVLIFNNASSVPESSAVVATLIENVSSNSSNFSLPVNTTSIVATRVVSASAPTPTPYTVMNATSAPSNRSTTTMVVNATSDHVTQSNTTATPSLSTSPVVNATVPPTSVVVNTSLSPTARLPTIQVPTTMASPATEAPLTSPKLSLRFSLTSTFNSSLSNSSSPEFLALANHVTTQLDKFFKTQFGARFNRTVVNSFRSGSIVVESTLIFNNISSVPNNSLVAQTLQTAITSNTSGLTLPINSSSIVVTRKTTHQHITLLILTHSTH
ncbi:mucin-5AC-like [Salvelinus fontinalis]|uniref:mucin-5AC-like n=1 Tax=Salvelinus fontinalis TaxID=8038 RepID=UPI002485CCAF|nr:mucin-5AC-like [Salvelinus fontinalis]